MSSVDIPRIFIQQRKGGTDRLESLRTLAPGWDAASKIHTARRRAERRWDVNSYLDKIEEAHGVLAEACKAMRDLGLPPQAVARMLRSVAEELEESSLCVIGGGKDDDPMPEMR
jgi:hypothetical protein